MILSPRRSRQYARWRGPAQLRHCRTGLRTAATLVRWIQTLQAAAEHDKVHPDPEPEVFFEDFGDNALVFSIYFWTDLTVPVTLRRLRSDLRFRIDELFSEADITIAFPQRDVHLDTLSPLQVRLTRDD